MKLLKLFKLFRLFPFITKSYAFVTNANFIILKEQKIFSEILDVCNIPCHLQCARVKTFQSTIEKLNRINKPNSEIDPNSKNVPNVHNIYNLHDLIGFRYVFYTKEDLLKFYHQIRLEKKVMYSKNYINEPKENGYSALHLRYKNEYAECPVKQLECQLYIIDDYYNAMYSHAMYFKNYTKLY
jgi:ppGpp synthetase/RelA/SpoT-type nucleotidyltranferase